MSAAGMREVVESVVIAFVLAFLFRTFEAEAFVIPTGSMAPTLMGRHKDVVCPVCGYEFQISASDEVDSRTGTLKPDHVIAGVCPMCRETMDLRPGNPQGETYRSYRGDRILVAKFAYRLSDPRRWDVAVFKYPGGAKTNFIKRIVGLPNETIAISHGDLFVKPVTQEDFERFGRPYERYGHVPIDLDEFAIARKPPDKIQAMLRPVYDNDYVLPWLIELGWPARWSRVARGDLAAGWETSQDFRSFHTDGAAEGDAWIAYHHVVPSFDDWQYLKGASPTMPPQNPDPKPQLITDFAAYNTDRVAYGSGGRFGRDESALAPDRSTLGLHWVGDLAVECTMEVESRGGEAMLALVEGGRIFQCRIDVASGQATLSIDGRDGYRPSATTPIRAPGSYRIMFANVDDQLHLWVDDRLVRFDSDTAYPRLDNTRPQPADLEPVRIGSRGAALRISHVKVFRDVYYIAQRLAPGAGGTATFPNALIDYDFNPYGYARADNITGVMSDPETWDKAFGTARQVAFPLAEDQFLVLGDNSPESKDSRLWECEYGPDGGRFPHYVRRDLLMGKALFIYWPHSLDTIPYTKIPVRFFPNFWRMHFVR